MELIQKLGELLKTFLRWFIVYKVTSGMQSLRQDVRYGMRLIKQSPFIRCRYGHHSGFRHRRKYSDLQPPRRAILCRNLPVWRPDRLVEVAATYRNGAKVPFSFPVFQQLQENQRVFSDLFAWTGGLRYNVEVDGALFLSSVRGVTGNYYSSLGASPLLGRFIGPEEAISSPGVPVAVIGYEFWEQRFADPSCDRQGDSHRRHPIHHCWRQPQVVHGNDSRHPAGNRHPNYGWTVRRSYHEPLVALDLHYWTAEGRCHHRASSRTITVVLA